MRGRVRARADRYVDYVLFEKETARSYIVEIGNNGFTWQSEMFSSISDTCGHVEHSDRTR
jgi:hypothetical protein